MALIRKVDCIRLYVSDLEAGLAFYRDRLGHELIWRTETAAGLRLPESDAELVLQTEDQRQEVDLLVDSADEAARQVEAAGGDNAEVLALRGRVRAYNARERVTIGNGYGFVTQLNSMLHQLFGMRPAPEKTKIRSDL